MATLTLTPNHDKKKGTAQADSINGQAGNDTITGLAGNDTLLGGIGTDSLDGGTDNDRLMGDAGNDTLLGGAGNDYLDGGADNDKLDGGAGADTLDGGTGTDTMSGGDGNDFYRVDNIGDKLTEAAKATSGIDSVKSSVNYTLPANVENLELTGLANLSATGNTLANKLIGNSGDNRLDGGSGFDTLLGGDGDDTLIGGAGVDQLTGGNGDDQVIYSGNQEDYKIDFDADSQTWTVQDINNDGTDEGTDRLTAIETVQFADSTVDASELGTGAGLPQLTVDDISLSEGNSGSKFATFQFTLSRAMADPVSVDFSTVDVTATAGSDYTAQSGTLSFAPGQTRTSLSISITGDTVMESNETFWLQLNNPTGLGLSKSTAIVTLSNDDTPVPTPVATNLAPTLNTAIATQTATEGTAFNLTLPTTTFSDPDGNTLTWSLIQSNGSALPSWLHFDPASRLLTGMPPANTSDLNLRVTVRDPAGLTASANFQLTTPATATTTPEQPAPTAQVGTLTNEQMDGTAGVDYLQGQGGNDTLTGYAGADTLDGGTGQDSLDGGDGNDRLLGGDENDTLVGGTGDDTLDGGAGDDNLQGGDDADRLIGGQGGDTMAGGAGNDYYEVNHRNDRIVETGQPNSGVDTVESSIDFSLAVPGLENLENLTLLEHPNIKATGNDLDNILIGNLGDNVLNGNGGRDTLTGGEGDDTLDGGGSADRLEGGVGDDTYLINTNEDTIIELANGGEADVVIASLTYTLVDQVEILTLSGSGVIDGFGNALDNIISGNKQNNKLLGKVGNDDLAGDLGNDTLEGGTGNDTLDGGEGYDTAVFNANYSDFKLTLDEGWMVEDSRAGTDIEGEDVVKNVEKLAFDDRNLYWFEAAKPIPEIGDFLSGTDQVAIRASAFGFSAPRQATPLSASAFYAAPGAISHDADDRFIYDTDTGQLSFDRDGNGVAAAIPLVILTGQPLLVAEDVILWE